MTGRREECKREETGTQWSMESEVGGEYYRVTLCLTIGTGKISLVAWLLCFSDLQLEPQYPSLCFY